MNIVPFIVTYNGMATGPCIQGCVDFLTAEAPASFGTAIEQIDIYARCQTRDPMLQGLGSMMDDFQSGLKTLPFKKFRRTAKLFELSYASDWVHSKQAFRESKTELSPSEFSTLSREFAQALFLIRGRIKKSDDFDVDAFESHLQRRIAHLPQLSSVQPERCS